MESEHGMQIKLLTAKIHRATVTQVDKDYVGSITIDADLLDATGLVPDQCVLVADLENGTRHETYVMAGERGSGTICINGAAALLVSVGDKVIIMAFAYVTPEQAAEMKPKVALVDEQNRVTRML